MDVCNYVRLLHMKNLEVFSSNISAQYVQLEIRH